MLDSIPLLFHNTTQKQRLYFLAALAALGAGPFFAALAADSSAALILPLR